MILFDIGLFAEISTEHLIVNDNLQLKTEEYLLRQHNCSCIVYYTTL